MARQNKNRLVSIDAVEERPRYGASKKEAELYERLRVKNRRIAELEEALGAKARGNAGQTLVVMVTPQMLEQLTWLTQSGLFGITSEGTAHQLLQLQLRDVRTMEIADREKWSTVYPLRKRRARRRPRRRPGKR